MNLQLENIVLSTYDINNEKHNEVLDKFENESKSQYIHDIKERIKDFKNKKSFPFDTGFFVVINNDIVGYMFISKNISDEVYLESSLLKEYRGKKYGKLILNDVSNYLMNEYNIRSLILDIDPSNIPSIRTAISCGYEIDEEEYLKRNMSGKILYRLDNYNYINKKRK